MPGLYTGATGLWGGFAGLLYGSSALSTPPGLLADAAWSPAQLFAQGEQGAWYDPSDLSTMFQDAAGTTPVTAVGQAVGLILDKSKSLALGNELATSPDLSWDASAALDTAVIGPVVAGRWYRFEWAGLSTTATSGVSLRVGVTNLSPARVVITSTSVSGVQYFEAPATGNFQVYATGPTASNVGSYASVSLKEIAGNHASQSTPTARPIYQSAGGLHYLVFDGTDDFLVTGTINPGSVDKSQVFAGVRKLSDAAAACLVELGTIATAVNGSVAILAPHTAAATYRFTSRGTAAASAVSPSSYAAPITNVVTGLGDISGDSALLRINGTQVAADTTTDQGTGNYASQIMYIGRRGGSTIPLNGQIYSLIVRFSAANLSDSVISQTETWVNSKTLAY